MRAVVQRVSRASVTVEDEIVGEIERGFRVFDDAAGAMNLALADVGGAVLLVSQFTLLGDVRRGRRPSFAAAARGESAQRLCERVANGLRATGLRVAEGRFGADMAVTLVNDGPVTILVDSKRAF